MGAFHAYDIRGVYNKDFDKELVYKVGFFLPELLQTDKVLVGRDVRVSSPEIHEYLLKGIVDAGVSVYDIGLATTPMVYYATASKGFKASVQITASHNPASDNGLKVSRENALPVGYDTGLGTIEKWINDGRACLPSMTPGNVFDLDIKDEYLAFQMKFKGDYSNLNIGVDLSNGMAALVIKKLLGKGSSRLHYIFDEMDGTFPNHEANPLIPKNTEALRALVKKEKCDIGVIYDGDADRVMFVDENSKFISPDLMIAVLGHFFLEGMGTSQNAKARKATMFKNKCAGKVSIEAEVLQDIRSSKAIGEYLEPMGGHINTWRVGRAYAAPKLREIKGLFGGELAGHYYFKDFYYSDSGIMASLILLDIFAQMKAERGLSVSQVIAGVVKYENSGEINFKIEDKPAAMNAVRDFFRRTETPTLSLDFDGYREEFPHWWYNIRPSNTEPYLRFICEASSYILLEEKVVMVREILDKFK